jgi:hypothetical protein
VRSIGIALATALICSAVAACGGQAPPPPVAITVSQSLITSTPPAVQATPVPVVHARTVPGAGRPDPFVALYGPPSASSTPAKNVAVSTFPHIPTLPGFGGAVHSIWDGVSLTGIVRNTGLTAIVQVNDQSYIVREGDTVAGRFRVAAIGPDFVTLATLGSGNGERTFSLGG